MSAATARPEQLTRTARTMIRAADALGWAHLEVADDETLLVTFLRDDRHITSLWTNGDHERSWLRRGSAQRQRITVTLARKIIEGEI